MSVNSDDQYRKYVKERVETLTPILARAAVGDYSMDVPMDTAHDDFSELYAGVQFMLEAIRDQLHEIDQRNDELRDKVSELERERASDEALLGSIGEAVVAVDATGTIVFTNNDMAEMIGLDRDKIVGGRFEDFVTEDIAGEVVPDEHRALSRVLKDGGRVATGDEYYYVVSGERFPVWVTASPIKVDDKVTGAISVSRNISQEKELDRMKSELVYLASHQLRTPASAVKSSLSLLLDGYMGKLTTEQLDDLRSAYTENDYELRLIDDILDVARLDSKNVELAVKKIDLSELLAKVAEEEHPAMEQNNQAIFLDLPKTMSVEGDSDKLRMVIENLVTNAIKYTPKGGSIEISAKQDAHSVQVHVKDTGIGIAPEDIQHLFKRFSRAANAISINMAGTGLGLYLAKSIIEMHHGHIEVESVLGKGSVFTIKMPKKYKEVING